MAMTIEEIQASLDAEALKKENESKASEAPSDGKLRLKKTIAAAAPKIQPPIPVPPAQSAPSASSTGEPGGFRSVINFITIIIILCGACYLGWRFVHKKSPVEPKRSWAEPAKEVAPVAVSATGAEPAFTELEVTCPTCLGAGRHQIPGAKLASSFYGCPVCASRGKRSLQIPRGQTVCVDCSGMGRKGVLDDFFATRQRYKAEACETCRGKGYR